MSEWISVKDRLPEPRQPVLVCADSWDGPVVTAATFYPEWNKGKPYWTGHGYSGPEWEFEFDQSDISHWMPLPEPPRAGG